MLQQVDRAAFFKDWQAWHEQRERDLADPHGFLAVTGLYWLSAEPVAVPRAPGRWWSDAEGAHVDLGDGEQLTVAGEAVTGRHDFGVIPERGGIKAAFGDAVIEVAKRGGRDVVRPRHPDNPLRLGFREVPAYPPNPRWALVARYRPFEQPRPTTVGSAVEGLQHVYSAPGDLEFELRGEVFHLTVFAADGGRGNLIVLFTDATSGLTTYPACRSLSLVEADAEGLVNLDFNRAANLPCAFTDFATCPLPPPENRLPVGIEAGEKTPYERA
jgi:uncharacterized protein